jgi:Leucine-rich repeat (LRR) protein
MKFSAIWWIFLFCLIKFDFANSFKCEFSYKLGSYSCYIKPDLSSLEDKHLKGKTDDNVKFICYNGTVNNVTNLVKLEWSQFNQRFKNLDGIVFYDVNSVDENLLQEFKNFDEFDLNNSNITEVPEKLFFEVPHLISIKIFKSKLSTLPENLFSNQRELKYLTIKKNQISCLPSNIFLSLTKLIYLNLNGNKIQYLNPKWFESLHFLSLLDLSKNKIEDLPKNVFANLENLKILYLKDNQLTTIHSDSFGIRKNKINIDLSYNEIKSIDKNITMKLFHRYFEGNVCGQNELINGVDLSDCYNNYKPREESSK